MKETDYIDNVTHTKLEGTVEITYWKNEKFFDLELDSVQWDFSRKVSLTREELIHVRDGINKVLEESAPLDN